MLKVLLSCIFVVALMGIVSGADALPIFIRPDGLGSGNNWPVGTYDSINEQARDDNDYVSSDPIDKSKRSSVVYSFSNAEDPVVDIDHVIRYAVRDNGNSAQNNPSLIVTLQQGDTDLITWTEQGPLSTAFTLVTHEIPPSIVGRISNYNDLRIKFTAQCEAGVTCANVDPDEALSISWVELQYETYTTPRSHPPPKITGIGFYNITEVQEEPIENPMKTDQKNFQYSKYTDTTDLQNYGKYKKTGKFFDTDTQQIPTFSGQVNKSIQLQIRLEGVFASTRIEHLSLISGNQKITSEFVPVNFEIIVDKGKKPMMIDPNKFLKKVNTSYSLEDGYLWVNIDLMFQKPLKKSNVVLQSWDEQRIPVYLEMPGMWEISDPSIVPAQKVVITRAVIRLAEEASLSQCDGDSCFEPSQVQIPKGGIITWVNGDMVLHTVISGDPKNGPDGKFNFAMIPGKIYEKQFSVFGTYKYYCSLHPWNTGIITVSEKPLAKTDTKYPYLNVISKPLWKAIGSDQKIVLPNHDMAVIIFGSIPEIKKPTPVNILIQKPDKSVEKLSVMTNKDGKYYSAVALSKKWQKGTFQIILMRGEQEIDRLSFVVSDK